MSKDVIEFPKRGKEYKAGFDAGYREGLKNTEQYSAGFHDGYSEGFEDTYGEISTEKLFLLLGARVKDLEERVAKAESRAENAYSMAVSKLDF